MDRYLEFVAGRARPNTLRAVAFDLKAFFTVVPRDPAPGRRAFRPSGVSAPATARAGVRKRVGAARLRSCDQFLTWGMLTERLCKACRSLASTHQHGLCGACGRDLPVDAGVCRPCRSRPP